MPSVEVLEENSNTDTQAVIGIIYPPPEVRSILYIVNVYYNHKVFFIK